MLAQKLFSTYDSPSPRGSLPEICSLLLERQKKSWQQLAEGYAGLDSVRVKEIDCGTFTVRLQFNPRRFVNTSAQVDPESVNVRTCFLCVENLPPAQRGILYLRHFLVLCNPAPIFSQHYTIAHIRHVPQTIGAHLETYLSLAEELGPRLTLFYNGAKCGASAPDHMHFQASPTGGIPVETEAGGRRRKTLRRTAGRVSAYSIDEYGRAALVLESPEREELAGCLRRLLRSMERVLSAKGEPMLNVLCSYRNHAWRVIVFPRRKHRPNVYFREGEDKILISPASVDMGGLVITPVQRDYERVDSKTIQEIFQEVSIDPATLDKIIDGI